MFISEESPSNREGLLIRGLGVGQFALLPKSAAQIVEHSGRFRTFRPM
jgi:hypothetical protein